MHIRSYTESLSDGSEVTNLVLRQDGADIILHACSPDDAGELVAKLAAAIQAHTVDHATVS